MVSNSLNDIGVLESSLMALNGIIYFIKHPSLWSFFLSILIPHAIISSIIFIMMFSSVWMLYLAISMIFSPLNPMGPWFAWMNFLHQVDMVAQIASDQLLYKTPQQLLFDAVLSKRGFDDVVVRGKLFRSVKVSWLTLTKRWILDLPHNTIEYPLIFLNAFLSIIFTFVPFVGPIVLVFINAPNRAYQFHGRYYELKGIDTRQRLGFYSSRRFEYFAFGIVTGILQQIPFVSTFFVFTSVTGAALWAAEFENQFAKRRQGLLLNDVRDHQRRSGIVMGPRGVNRTDQQESGP